MRTKWKFLLIKIRLSASVIAWLLKKWQYALLATMLSIIFFELVFWMFNLGLLTRLLMSTALPIGDKFALLISPFESVGSVSGAGVFVMMIALSIIQGISLSALIYAIRHQPKVDTKLLGGSTLVGVLALIGLGCPACGTSLITPIVAVFASSSAMAISEQITLFALPLAIIIGLYGIYVLGLRISTMKAQREMDGRPS